MALGTGQVLNNRYRIVRLLGQGGFGAVYRAWDMQMESPCAVKENLATSPEAIRQFEREARILFTLRHSNLPKVYDQFTIAGQGQYLVMDFIEGEDMQSMIDKQAGPLQPDKVLDWVSQVCDALTYLHNRQPPVIHRDIKPANIRITPEGEAVLVDFGIAKEYADGESTTSGARAVTPGYSPPEQYGEGTTDAQSDIYALGATTYTLLTGIQPASAMDLVSGTREPLTPADEVTPSIRREVSQAIQDAMKINRAERTRTVVEFKQSLIPRARTIAQPAQPESLIQASPAQEAPPPRQPKPGRSKWILWVAGIAVIILLAAASIFIWNALQEKDTAETPVEVSQEKPGEEPAWEAEQAELQAELQVEEQEGEPPPGESADQEPPRVDRPFTACMVTDIPGINDRSFNETTWQGMLQAQENLGVEVRFLESAEPADYERNIFSFIESGCDLIVTVGFLLGDATAYAAESNPDQRFTIVDYSYEPPFRNVLGQVFNINEAAFLAGYLAAGVTRTGRIATYGGMQIPTVTQFMDGFWMGADYYNQRHGTRVEVLGWDPNSQTGLFAGNFESLEDGQILGNELITEGADIILPVAGPVGYGTAMIAQERGNVYIIGVDSDWAVSAPEFANIILTSVLKRSDRTTFAAIEAVLRDDFKGGTLVGMLANEGVGLAPFHELEYIIPDELRVELEEIIHMIIEGAIPTTP